MNQITNIFFLRLIAFLTIASLTPPSLGFCEQEPVSTLRQLVKTISDSQPENPFIPEDSKTLSSENIFSHIHNKMKNQDIHVLDGKNLDTPLSNLDFLNIANAFSGGPQNKNLIDKKLYLKGKGFIASTDIGLATEVKGEVTQYHNNSSYGKTVSLASPLFQFDQIETARKSRAAFTLDDKSRLILSSASNISIDKNIYDPKNRFREMLFRMSKGTAHFIVSKAMKKGSTFAVITPNGIAGVRGTEFVTMVEPDGNTRFVVLEGKIETAPRLPGGKWGKRTFIGAGEMQTLSKQGQASRVQKAPVRLLNHFHKNSETRKNKKNPQRSKEAKRRLNKSKSLTKNKTAKVEASQDPILKQRDMLKNVLGTTNPSVNQTIDHNSLRAFNRLSQPSRLDQFKSRYQTHQTSQARDPLNQKALTSP
ncbi:MAG: FecR domain-containing protein [Nitrospina sp.]|jgi:hypothetical protein|nr:FecR domain-containing protein [Nitrospina sp.]MBT5469637.1 FecR domain-containing protein [Nitrospina sp.]MBT6716681.1 FecR domain-containing protein [Nitrospina sp.]